MTRLQPGEYHVPVMAQTCLDYLKLERDGVIVDATLGGGGHTRLILDAMQPGNTLLAFDADEFAIERSKPLVQYAAESSKTLHLIHANFETIGSVLHSYPLVSAVLFDLGVSSFQFDYHPRGFSYRQDAPLDMRFTSHGHTAADVVNTYSEEELTHVFRAYGEDPSAKRLATAIVRRRTIAPYKTTVDLRDTIIQHIPPQHQPKTLARIFQALRIEVNNELEHLQTALECVLPRMAPDGRVVVMSYHSLEDAVVKNVFREHHRSDGPLPRVELLTRKPVMATLEEVSLNPRARSARLRAARIVEE